VSEASHGIVIAQFADESQAHMAASRLGAEDIRAVVLDTLRPRALGVRRAALAVAEQDAPRAIAVLKTTPAAPYLLPDAELR
jgi:hypothetical protein